MVERRQIIEVLEQCYDPELPVDLWNLGLIYSIDIHAVKKGLADINITMPLTTPGCGMGGRMSADVTNRLKALDGVNAAHMEITFDPQWRPEMMTDKARQRLGFPINPGEHQPTEVEEARESWE